MKVAFTSCFHAGLFPQQPVWQEIAAESPDVLVLLGDAMYLDVGDAVNTSGVQLLSETEFAQRAHAKFRAQLQQPDFQALIARPGLSTFAIWDDHDFLWNDACGGDVMKSPVKRPLIYPSRAVFAAFREALAGQPFPSAPPAWSTNTPAPGYSHVPLGGGVHLHLTDGRSFRERGKTLLGAQQLQAMQGVMAGLPASATHLVASSSVVEQRNGEAWMKFKPDYAALLQLAGRHNVLVLSGDIHDNNLAAYDTQGRRFFEATASGAALRTGVVIGSLQRNWGLLDIDTAQVGIGIFKSGVPQYRGSIDRATWH